jgi:hypothetical protein
MATQTIEVSGRTIAVSERAGRLRAVLGSATYADPWGVAHQNVIAVYGSTIEEIEKRAASCIAGNQALRPGKGKKAKRHSKPKADQTSATQVER